MKLEEAKGIVQKLVAWFDLGNKTTTLNSEEFEAVVNMAQELDRLQDENEELSCVKKAIKVYKTNVGTENCQFVLMSESEFLNSFNYKCLLDDYISKDKVKDCLDDIEDYFENVSVPYEDIEFIKEKRKDLLKEE